MKRFVCQSVSVQNNKICDVAGRMCSPVAVLVLLYVFVSLFYAFHCCIVVRYSFDGFYQNHSSFFVVLCQCKCVAVNGSLLEVSWCQRWWIFNITSWRCPWSRIQNGFDLNQESDKFVDNEASSDGYLEANLVSLIDRLFHGLPKCDVCRFRNGIIDRSV